MPRALAWTVLALLAAAPAAADSQSSNSSSNCSNGHCTRVDTYTEERGRARRGWTRFESWQEGPRWRPRWRHHDDD